MHKKRNNWLLTTALALGSSITVVPAFAQTATAPTATQGNGNHVDEIIVTARRRDENLQVTPVSVTALSATELVARHDSDINDIAQSVPNLAISPAVATKNGARITLRGQVQNDALMTLDPSVGVYVNDVYFARAYSVLNDLLDVQQVEVLKGPQGTLYGRNTTGGAIKIETQAPALAGGFSGFVNGGVGNFNSRDVTGAVTIPLIENKLAIRYAAGHHEHDGYTKSYVVTEPGLAPVQTVDSDNLDTDNQRLTLLFKPNDSLSFELVGSMYRADDNGSLVANIGGDIENITAPPPAFAFGFTTSPQRKADFYSALTPVAPFSNARNSTVTLNTRYDINPNFYTKLILGYVNARNHSRTNAAGVVTGSVALVEFSPDLTQRQHQFSAEWQLGGSAADDKLNWIGGLYYFKENGIESAPATTRVFGAVSAVAFVGTLENSSKSIYADASYKWTDRFSTSAGLRYTSDDKALLGMNRRQTGVCVYTPGVGVTTSVVPGGPCLLDRSNTFDYTTWEVEADYRFSDDMFGYAKAGNGYRSGGQQLRSVDAVSAIPFTPEQVRNYEAGLKSEFFDRQIRLNIALFHTDYSNIQQSIIDSPPAFPTTTTQVVNQGKATVDGLEAEAVARVTPHFTLSGALGYTDFQFETAGLQQVYTPKNKASVSAVYTVPLSLGDLVGRLDYDYQSKFAVSPSKTVNSNLGGRSLLNARLSLDLKSGVELAIWGKNLTEEEYFTNGIVSANLFPGAVGAPRTFGVEATYRF